MYSDIEQLRGTRVVDTDGSKIGTVDEIYLDRDTNQPEWALVNTGLFGTRSSFVPLHGAQPTGNELVVQYPKDQVKNAPSIEPDRDLSETEEAELYRYYGLTYDESHSDSTPRPDSTTGYDETSQGTDDAMTRSQEQVRIRTAAEETGRARLRKYIVTDEVQQTVPVRREEVRIEREPITEANRDEALDGPEISEAEHEVTLHAERPVVQKETVPVERVRLEKDVVTDEANVSETVRKEEIDLEGGDDYRR